jgi:hypothetical protein
VRSIRKPSAGRKLAVLLSPPEQIERRRSRLQIRDATLVSVVAYAGCGHERRSRRSGVNFESARQG